MKVKNDSQELLKDYEDFLKADFAPIPLDVKNRILRSLQKMVNPNPISVFSKILRIHAVIGFSSLSICHQFGLNPFKTESYLTDWMMYTGGHYVCMIGCGILFVGISLLLGGYFLSIEEIGALRKTQFLQIAALGILSLGFLLAFGAKIALNIGILWLIGAMVGGIGAVQTIFRIRPVVPRV